MSEPPSMAKLLMTQDMHVHSTFAEGKSTIEENVAEAERIGLTELTCVDHVQADTKWVPEYVAAVREIAERTPIRLHCAVEAKILDTEGRLDLLEDLDGVDAIYAADHRVPSPEGPMDPSSTRELIEAGELNPSWWSSG